MKKSAGNTAGYELRKRQERRLTIAAAAILSNRDEKTKRDSDEFLTRDDEEKSFVTIQFSRFKEKTNKNSFKGSFERQQINSARLFNNTANAML